MAGAATGAAVAAPNFGRATHSRSRYKPIDGIKTTRSTSTAPQTFTTSSVSESLRRLMILAPSQTQSAANATTKISRPKAMPGIVAGAKLGREDDLRGDVKDSIRPAPGHAPSQTTLPFGSRPDRILNVSIVPPSPARPQARGRPSARSAECISPRGASRRPRSFAGADLRRRKRSRPWSVRSARR